MSYKLLIQDNNEALQDIFNQVIAIEGGISIEELSFVPTDFGKTSTNAKLAANNNDLLKLLEIAKSLKKPIRVIPSQDGEVLSTGSEVSPTWLNFNTEELEISGEISGIQEGYYEVEFTPKEGYAWIGGNTSAIKTTWKLTSKWADLLVDFYHIDNGDTATITGWKGTLNGVPSTELIVPDDSRIII